MIRRIAGFGAVLAAGLAATGTAEAHPHVFAEARMEIVGDGTTVVKALRNIWRMDEMFSTTVVVDYDKNHNGVLDDDELQAVGDTVKESIAEYDFYTFVHRGGASVKMQPPSDIRALFQDGQLLIFFEMAPAEPLDLAQGPINVATFDETFFTAFEFAEDGFQLVDLPASCKSTVTVPDEDESAQQWMASIASIPADGEVPEGDGAKYAEVLATRAEIKCG